MPQDGTTGRVERKWRSTIREVTAGDHTHLALTANAEWKREQWPTKHALNFS